MGWWNKIKRFFIPEKRSVVVIKNGRSDPDLKRNPQNNDEIATIKFRMLVVEAERWLYVREQGQNRGREVEMFQKAVDGKAAGEPWCAAFIEFCIGEVDRIYQIIHGRDNLKSQLYKSEHCLSIWNKSPVASRINTNLHPGLICIWQHYRHGKATSAGHIGVVKRVLDDTHFLSIEGNTKDHSKLEREGDGVYSVRRSFASSENFRLKGFIRPWDGAYLDSYY